MADEKKGITVKIDADLHAEIRQYIESQGMTMAEFVSKALYDELHPQIQPQQEVKNMGPMRTMAFQMPEDMFQRLKDYLHEHNMTQKEFVLGLVEAELNRDQELKNAQTAEKQIAPEEYADDETEDFGEEPDVHEGADEDEELGDDESENEDFDEELDEPEEADEDEELSDDESENEDFDEELDEPEEADEDEESEEEVEDEALSLAM
jgi:hypothetical protein